jgi:hypothetical protein
VVDNDLVMASQPLDNLARLPIPEYHIPRARPARDILAVWRKANVACVAGNSVACETLLFDLAEGAVCGVYEDLVVE